MRLVLIEYIKKTERGEIFPFGTLVISTELQKRNIGLIIANSPVIFGTILKRTSLKLNDTLRRELSAIKEVRDFIAEIKAINPNVVGFKSYESKIDIINLIIWILRKNIDAYFLLGGPLATLLKGHALEFIQADFSFIGEAEKGLPKLLKAIGKKRPSMRLPETYGEAFSGCPHLVIKNVQRADEFYKWDFISEKRMNETPLDFNLVFDYSLKNFPSFETNPVMSYSSSRGCPYACIFCSNVMGKIPRAFSPEKMVADLLEIKKLAELKIRKPREKFIISFGDDNFLLERGRAARFFQKVIKFRLNEFFQFTIQASISTFFTDIKKLTIDEGLIDLLTQGNVKFISFGTDNFCDEELRRLKKFGYTKAHIFKLVERLDSKGLYNNHYCIISNLDTTLENIRENLEAIIELDKRFLKFIQLRPIMYIQPYYGTQIWNELNSDPALVRSCVEKIRRGSGGIWLGRRVLPRDAVVREVLYKMEHEIKTKSTKNVPYYYDFESALNLVQRAIHKNGT